MIPSVTVTKARSQTGVVRPGADGILAILSTMSTGTQNAPATYTRPDDIVTAGGPGRLPSLCAYALGQTQNPVVAELSAASTAATYGTITHTGTGASVATGDGAVLPYDQYSVLVLVVTGGTVGVAGITYQYSLDGGVTYSAVLALGTATFIQIANTGVKLNFSAASMVAGDTYACLTSPPYPTTTDLVPALAALGNTAQPWDAVLVDTIGTSTVITQLDTFLQGLEARGMFRSACVNLRMKGANGGVPGETEAAYAAYVAGVMGSVATDRVVVGVDGGDSLDYSLGVNLPRPASLAGAARAEKYDLAIDPAYVGNGPISGFSISDAASNPKYHDEDRFPGLDALRTMSLRTFAGLQGVYITNANVASGNGSDFVYWQQLRVLNKACEISWQILVQQLSLGVTKNPKPGPAGQIYISEQSARKIEGLVNAALAQPMKGRDSAVLFTLNRDDDIGSNAGATIGSKVQVVGLAYVKKFKVSAGFVRSL